MVTKSWHIIIIIIVILQRIHIILLLECTSADLVSESREDVSDGSGLGLREGRRPSEDAAARTVRRAS